MGRPARVNLILILMHCANNTKIELYVEDLT